MANKQKYVRTENDEIIIFPETIQHLRFRSLKPVSAGFCEVKDQHVVCSGNSISLGLESDKEEDSMLATLHMFGLDAATRNELKSIVRSVL